jgi:hypothetical protein
MSPAQHLGAIARRNSVSSESSAIMCGAAKCGGARAIGGLGSFFMTRQNERESVGILRLPIPASILSLSTSSNDTFSPPRRPESEKPAGDYRENVGGDD